MEVKKSNYKPWKWTMLVLFLLVGIPFLGAQDQPVKTEISKAEAKEDLAQLQGILERYSSYLELKNFDYKSALIDLEEKLEEEVSIQEFCLQLEKFIGAIGDRHARVKPSTMDRLSVDTYLPFIAAPLDGKVVALKANTKQEKGYSYFLSKYPYLKAIEGIVIEEFLDGITWRHKHAPEASSFYYAVSDLRNLGLQFHKLNMDLPKEVKFTFTNGNKDKVLSLAPLDKKLKRWKDESAWEIRRDTSMLLKENIGYFKISSMFSPRRVPEFFENLPKRMEEFKNTDAIIIDIRNNGGGTRDILNAFAPYFKNPETKPWVANMAKIRCDQNFNEDMESMRGRYLYSYRSREFSKADREAIKEYSKDFKTEWDYDETKYSGPFFMVFTHERGKDHYYYDKPVYILVNELCFSAASVFTTALHGMGNIKIVGVNTDGSSGRSNYFNLEHSQINLKLSTMISFQRNGKTLDCNGTKPDIYLPRDMDQVLRKKDSQLENLLKIIIAQ